MCLRNATNPPCQRACSKVSNSPCASPWSPADGRGNTSVPARVHYRAVSGTRDEKLEALDHLCSDDAGWQECLNGTLDPFAPPGASGWPDYPPLSDLLPWQSPGVKANRTWVIAPDPEVLQRRWERLIGSKPDERDALLKVTRDRTSERVVGPVPGYPQPLRPLCAETSESPQIVPYAFRSFDRQYLILDTRVIDRVRPDLWSVSSPEQVFISEPHTNVIDHGPALTFSATVPDMHYFQGHHGGRVLPLYRDAAGTSSNVAPGLLEHLRRALSREVSAEDLVAYIAAIAAHPGYTRRFREDLAVRPASGSRLVLMAKLGIKRS